MDNCAKCGLELEPRRAPTDSCPRCGATARVVDLGRVQLTARSSIEATPEVVQGVGGIPSVEAFGEPTVIQHQPAIDYARDLCLFQIEQLTRASFIGVCESDNHEPFLVAGADRAEVLRGLSAHLESEH